MREKRVYSILLSTNETKMLEELKKKRMTSNNSQIFREALIVLAQNFEQFYYNCNNKEVPNGK